MQQREKLILSKYMQAEDVRETRKVIKETMELMKYQPKLKLYKISKHQMDLEDRLAEAWKDRQEKLSHLNRKHRLQSIDNASILHKKIKKEAKVQDSKLIRNEKPNKPLLEPLPYMKKIRENLSKSMEMIDTPSPKRTPSPEVTYVTKRIKFELVDKVVPNALQRQETKKFYTDIKSKV
jgi:quinol monooxygenase YgiN